MSITIAAPAETAAQVATESDATTRQWRPVCRLADLEPMWGEAALIGGTQIALVRLYEDAVHAVSQWDPFARANVMSRGIVGSKAGRPTIASPIHKQSYDLQTGKCLSEEGLQLDSYAVRVVEGTVEVHV
ncbi:nitrite reductase small subunit NirD [Nesterenkonia lutea]|uniref:Nitrite reductase (NADH) small subunit n=1 Tax=Nesterenkonia lutea TaxID=272919 RepID=A0ABR9JAQ8_9MICC|nr:nitrite reductase small subunit NirD [Nesterenkonia lutea]MBE1523011.1 nitrite reductase (NADH) small subunit [Nesterenkonia lutea]